MKRNTIGMLFLTLMTGLAGCSAIGDGFVECEMCIRNGILAQKAWGHWSWCYDKLDYPAHFAKGFKAGYRNILDGGNGCQPTLPPKCYWTPTFQSPEGRCMTHSWFDGFSHGALAAKQDGYGSLGDIPISPTARTNIEMARRPPQQNIFQDSTFLPGADGMSPIENGSRNTLIDPPGGDGVENGDSTNGVPPIQVPTRPYE